eukprot:PhF_6_TR19009/c0_g1_i1/m.27865
MKSYSFIVLFCLVAIVIASTIFRHPEHLVPRNAGSKIVITNTSNPTAAFVTPSRPAQQIDPSDPFIAGGRPSSSARPPPHCPDRYLYVGTKFGRHFNQITSIIAGVVLAQEWNRTFVIPSFHQSGRRYQVQELYTFTLQNKYCVIMEEQFLSSFSGKLGVGCIIMRGVDEIPTNPGNRFFCEKREFAKFKKNLTLVRSVSQKLNAHRVLQIPLVIYLAPQISTHCVWKYVAPSSVIQKAVRTFQEKYTLPTNGYSAIHLRSLEGSCSDRIREEGFLGNTQHPLPYNMCSDNPNDIVSGIGASAGTKFFMADDRQRPKLSAGLKALGGVQMDEKFPELSPLQSMLVEFWLLVESKTFANNPLSTLSSNVCRKRFVENKDCVLWIGKPLERCI